MRRQFFLAWKVGQAIPQRIPFLLVRRLKGKGESWGQDHCCLHFSFDGSSRFLTNTGLDTLFPTPLLYGGSVIDQRLATLTRSRTVITDAFLSLYNTPARWHKTIVIAKAGRSRSCLAILKSSIKGGIFGSDARS